MASETANDLPGTTGLSEVEQLRAQVKAYQEAEAKRQHEFLLDTIHERDHWKAECTRNIEIGRQIAAQAEETIALLRNEIQTLRETYARRSTGTR